MRGESGRPPSHETLVRIMRVENVSLSWLLGAKVPPFLRIVGVDATESADLLRMHLEDEAGWRVAMLTDGLDIAIVLHQPAAIEHDKNDIPYRAVAVLAGPHGAMTSKVLSDLRNGRIDASVALSRTDLQRVQSGHVGSWLLFGDTKSPGLIPATASPCWLHETTLPRVAEAGAIYATPAPALAIKDAWDTLPEDVRQALALVVDRMVTPPTAANAPAQPAGGSPEPEK